MNVWEAMLLGLIQGLTEFLPVSSSGHLVLTGEILKVNDPSVSFEVMVHLGTLLSVLVYFRKRILTLVRAIWDKDLADERRIIWYLIIGTVPAGVAGLLLKDFFESAFSNPALTSAMLLVTGALLLATKFAPKDDKRLTWLTAILMGCGQALAIMPGISRSGSTIAVGLLARVNPSVAAEFSFLLAIPAIAGAAVLQLGDLNSLSASQLTPYLAGGAIAFVTGLIAVYAVLTAIRKGQFAWFSYYCFAAGALGLYLFL